MPDIRVEDLPPVWLIVDYQYRKVDAVLPGGSVEVVLADWNSFGANRGKPYRAVKYAAVEVVQEGGSDG